MNPRTALPISDAKLVYTVAGTYDKSNGKFSQIFGNVAIIDCAYFFYNLLDAVQVEVNKMPF